MLEPLLSSLLSPLLTRLIAAIKRIFITANPVLETNFTFQNTKTFPDDFDLSIDAVLPTAATTVTLYGQVASADHYIKVLSTGFVSINIDTSIVTSTVLATKDNKQRRYGVRVVGDDFIFTEDGATIDTVTDAVAAAKTLIINAIAQSNGADFFDGTLSDPILTDLTTASNSVSWKINRAFPATTEAAIGGGNDLTYNNAPDSIRELFTFINGEWDGVERVVNGGFDADTDWIVGTGFSIAAGVAVAGPFAGPFQRLTNVGASFQVGENVRIKVTCVEHTASNIYVRKPRDVTTIDTDNKIDSVGDFVFNINIGSDADELAFANITTSTDLKIDNVSAKRVIEVA